MYGILLWTSSLIIDTYQIWIDFLQNFIGVVIFQCLISIQKDGKIFVFFFFLIYYCFIQWCKIFVFSWIGFCCFIQLCFENLITPMTTPYFLLWVWYRCNEYTDHNLLYTIVLGNLKHIFFCILWCDSSNIYGVSFKTIPENSFYLYMLSRTS